MTTRHILLYSGVSLLSRAIQLQTWSRTNHVAYVLPDYRIVDMWKRGGRIIDTPLVGHNQATRIWMAAIRMEDDQAAQIDKTMMQMTDKKYAYGQIIGFLARRTPRAYRDYDCHSMPLERIKRFVCSGAIQYAFCRAGRPLVNKPWYKTSPADIAESTELRRKYEVSALNWEFFTGIWRADDGFDNG